MVQDVRNPKAGRPFSSDIAVIFSRLIANTTMSQKSERLASSAASAQFPLHELLAFEAAARLGSFQKAADELSVTQSAVSHRVINLERRLGVSLFVRKGRGIALTEDGERQLAGVSSALSDLWETGEALRLAEHSLVRLAFAPAVGSVWLAPQLPEFLRQHPQLQIEVTTVATPEEVNRGDWDVLLHYGTGVGDEARRTALLTDEVVLVACPVLLGQGATELTEAMLASTTLLRHPMVSWSAWSAGVFGRKAEPARTMHFDDSIAQLAAAVGGAGIALTTRLAAAPYLEQGSLVQVHPHTVADQVLYVETSESGELKPVARHLVDWMVRLAQTHRV